jgi:hypothetical protein
MPDSGEYHGQCLGELGYPQLLEPCHSHPLGGIDDGGAHRLESDDRIAQDGKQRIEEQRQEGGLPAESKHRECQDDDCRWWKGLDERVEPEYELLEILSGFAGDRDTDHDSHYRGKQGSPQCQAYMGCGHL